MKVQRAMAALVLVALLPISLIVYHQRAQAGSALPACAVALQLTPDTFALVYTGITGDVSEAGLDSAAYNWIQCKEQATTRLTAGHAALAARIAQLRLLFARVRESETTVASLRAGGGTLYVHSLNRAGQGREQQLADIAVLALNGLAGSPTAGYKLAITTSLSDIGQRLGRLEHPTKNDVQFTTRAMWNSAVGEYTRAIQALERAAGTRDDAIRAAVLAFADQPLFLN